jgi:hypothetical protein
MRQNGGKKRENFEKSRFFGGRPFLVRKSCFPEKKKWIPGKGRFLHFSPQSRFRKTFFLFFGENAFLARINAFSPRRAPTGTGFRHLGDFGPVWRFFRNFSYFGRKSAHFRKFRSLNGSQKCSFHENKVKITLSEHIFVIFWIS